MTRKAYLDWLRGVAVLIMIEAHLFDSWVQVADRSGRPYRWAISVGGFSAPSFLFLAGIAMMLAAEARVRRGVSIIDVGRAARRRGWQILGLAYLFRVQSFVISGGSFPQTLLKVDILNVIGLSMVMAVAIWSAAARWAGPRRRVAQMTMLGGAAVAFAMVTPLVRAAQPPSWLPYPLEWHLRAVPGSGAFTLFPWAGFLLAGCGVGQWLARVQTDREERRVMVAFLVTGTVMAFAAYGASFLPPLFPMTTFWTGSPTFFFVRLGILMTAIPVAYLWSARAPAWSPVRKMGVASLFVYWIHVEIVYGVASLRLHRTLSFGSAVLAYLGFCILMYGLVKLKDRLVNVRVPLPRSVRPASD